MSHDSELNPLKSGDEDDWETAEFAPARPKKSSSTPQIPSLRPSAPAFIPKPAKPARGILARPGGSGRNSTEGRSQVRTDDGKSGKQEEDEWFGSRRPASNRQIWDSANASTSTPPIILAPTISNPSQHSTLPPTRTLQILRRPTSDQPNKRSTSNQPGPKTLSEREEEYRLARERIFGPGGSSETVDVPPSTAGGKKSKNNSRKNSPSPKPNVQGGGVGEIEEELGRFVITPSQIRRSPFPSEGGQNRQGAGVIRQPMGPQEVGGFGAAGGGGYWPGAAESFAPSFSGGGYDHSPVQAGGPPYLAAQGYGAPEGYGPAGGYGSDAHYGTGGPYRPPGGYQPGAGGY